MDPFTMLIAGVGIATSLFGADRQRDQQREFAEAMGRLNSEKSQIQQRQNEALAARATRDAIRRAQVARGIAVNYGGNSGLIGSSGMEGALGQISGQQNAQTSAISNDLLSSNQLIDVNSRMSALNSQNAIDTADNQFLSMIGQTITGNAGALSRLGQTGGRFLQDSFAPSGWQTSIQYG